LSEINLVPNERITTVERLDLKPLEFDGLTFSALALIHTTVIARPT
jgi:hypothetical protein